MSYIVAVFLTLVGAGLVFGVRAYARMRVHAANQYKEASEGFFDAAKPLISDDETPDEIVGMIKFLNETIRDRKIARLLVSTPENGGRSEGISRLTKVTEEFFAARPELRDSYRAMYLNWFIAVTALAPIAGFAARYQMISDESKRNAAAKASRKKSHHNNGDSAHHGDGLAQAA